MEYFDVKPGDILECVRRTTLWDPDPSSSDVLDDCLPGQTVLVVELHSRESLGENWGWGEEGIAGTVIWNGLVALCRFDLPDYHKTLGNTMAFKRL